MKRDIPKQGQSPDLLTHGDRYGDLERVVKKKKGQSRNFISPAAPFPKLVLEKVDKAAVTVSER